MTNLQEMNKYEWIKFNDNRTNLSDKKAGAKIGRYLVVTCINKQWRIFQIWGGLPITDIVISEFEDAVKIAQAIEDIYKEYLGIWEVWIDVDVLEIARLSVDYGEAVCDTLHELFKLNRPINYNEFITTLKKHITDG